MSNQAHNDDSFTDTNIAVPPTPQQPPTIHEKSPTDVLPISTEKESYTTSEDDSQDDGLLADSPRSRHLIYGISFLSQAAIFLATLAFNVFAVIQWQSPWWLHALVQVAVLVSAIVFIQRADARWEAAGDIPLEEGEIYSRIPHISMFFNSIILQLVIWSVALGAGVWMFFTLHESLGWNVLVQLVVTILNLYLIRRSYVKWSGIDIIATKGFVTIKRSDSILYLIFREKEKSIRKDTLVSQTRKTRNLAEYLLFKHRGTVLLTTQTQNDQETVPIRYVSRVEDFMDALKKT